jgi:hypothetical protein
MEGWQAIRLFKNLLLIRNNQDTEDRVRSRLRNKTSWLHKDLNSLGGLDPSQMPSIIIGIPDKKNSEDHRYVPAIHETGILIARLCAFLWLLKSLDVVEVIFARIHSATKYNHHHRHCLVRPMLSHVIGTGSDERAFPLLVEKCFLASSSRIRLRLSRWWGKHYPRARTKYPTPLLYKGEMESS